MPHFGFVSLMEEEESEEGQVMKEDPFLSTNAFIQAELSHSQEYNDDTLTDYMQSEAILDESINEFLFSFECADTRQLSNDSITTDSTEEGTSSSESSVFLANAGVDASLDVEEIDQNSFQVLFKSLRSRPIFFQELFGERTRTNCQNNGDSSRSRSATIGTKFPYACNHCDHVFKYFTLFEQHLKTHNLIEQNLEFNCNLCSFVNTNKSKLKRHVLSKHPI